MIFIIGAASVGKTSLVNQLKEKLPARKFDIHDIDEADLWTDSYEKWRDAKIEHWLKQSIINRENGIETILCGIIYPAHVVKSSSYGLAKPVEYILLDAHADAIKERFYKRMESKINKQVEIAGELKSELQTVKNKQVVDTTDLSIEDIANTVLKTIRE